MVRLKMARAHLRDLPVHPLPPPWWFRAYRPGDEDTWVRIQQAADLYQPITRAVFTKAFSVEAGPLAERLLFLCDADGREIGTAAAWWGEAGPDSGKGRIHWVAVVPAAQGRGLGRPLIAATCLRLAELGHTCAYLTTGDRRERAIRLYLEFGFVPEIMGEADRAAWEDLRRRGLPVPYHPDSVDGLPRDG